MKEYVGVEWMEDGIITYDPAISWSAGVLWTGKDQGRDGRDTDTTQSCRKRHSTSPRGCLDFERGGHG